MRQALPGVGIVVVRAHVDHPARAQVVRPGADADGLEHDARFQRAAPAVGVAGHQFGGAVADVLAVAGEVRPAQVVRGHLARLVRGLGRGLRARSRSGCLGPGRGRTRRARVLLVSRGRGRRRLGRGGHGVRGELLRAGRRAGLEAEAGGRPLARGNDQERGHDDGGQGHRGHPEQQGVHQHAAAAPGPRPAGGAGRLGQPGQAGDPAPGRGSRVRERARSRLPARIPAHGRAVVGFGDGIRIGRGDRGRGRDQDPGPGSR